MTVTLDKVLDRFPESQQAAICAACIGFDGDINEGLVEYYARVIPQPLVAAASIEELPKRIERKCCSYKSCRNTALTLQVSYRYEPVGDLFRQVPVLAYVRDSNGDDYWSGDLTEALTFLNDPTIYPVREESR